ncbi:hypothetical protein OG897_18975 [Streptomyces sp. NBC_00237]|uniref:hypothetical protein n=1 Tax=Streptomyces sp. NBC_00237 TaxID=2975687 RepID=UPI00225BF4B0|nr:hypothetical protein [Streptomyces sp. NBC_00237]MCX5203524.1 hypothetical protein [Streptomyces sp. NBC_00237]
MTNGTARKAGQAAMGLGSADRAGKRASGPVAGHSWLLRGKDGRLSAYAVTDGGLLRWTETRPGGPDWEGPEFFEAASVEGLAVAQGPDGFVHVVGRGVAKDGAPDYVHATQYQSGRPFGGWHSLGSYRYSDPARTAELGLPSVAVGAGGAVHVFLRNAYGGVLLRSQTAGGKWGGWQDLIGSRSEGTPVATRLASDRIELFAVKGDGTVLRWTQEKPGAPFAPVTVIPFTVAAGTVSALETADDSLTYYGTAPAGSADATDGGTGTGEAVAFRPQPAPEADPTAAPAMTSTPLGGTPSTASATLRTSLDGHDCTVLAHRTTEGRPVLAACRTLAEAEGVWWSPTGPPCVGAPALALDAADRVVMAVISTDGTLHTARQRTDEEGLSLAAWRPA